MPKLQRIKRANGSLVFSVNIPLEIIEELGWEKGTVLFLEINKDEIMLRKQGKDLIPLSLVNSGLSPASEKDKLNEKEKNKNDTKI